MLADTYGQSMAKMFDTLSWTTTDEVLPLHARRVAAQLREKRAATRAAKRRETPAQGA